MRCDLHVHSARSGAATVPLLGRVAKESYAEPVAVYEALRAKGMDLVTLTDHDTIEGALEIAGLPGGFVSEEVTVYVDGVREIHLGVFDISETQHEAIAGRRHDAEALLAYLAEARVPTAFNHPFSALTGRRELKDLHLALARVDLVETRNGMLPQIVNDCARAAARAARLPGIGGSDAHALGSVAAAFTEVAGARSKEEFLDGLRRGLTVPMGRSGTYARMTRDLLAIAAGTYRHHLARAARGEGLPMFLGLTAALPSLLAMPMVSAFLALNERRFAPALLHRYQSSLGARLRPEPASAGPWGMGPMPAEVV